MTNRIEEALAELAQAVAVLEEKDRQLEAARKLIQRLEREASQHRQGAASQAGQISALEDLLREMQHQAIDRDVIT